MERKKIVGTPFKTANGENVGYNINVGFENSNKTLPTGEEIRIVSAGKQLVKERQESTKYRLTSDIKQYILHEKKTEKSESLTYHTSLSGVVEAFIKKSVSTKYVTTLKEMDNIIKKYGKSCEKIFKNYKG